MTGFTRVITVAFWAAIVGGSVALTGIVQWSFGYGDGVYFVVSGAVLLLVAAVLVHRGLQLEVERLDNIPAEQTDLSFEFTIDAYNAIEALAAEHGATESDIIAAIDAFEDEYPPELQERWWDAWEPPEVHER